MRVRNILCNMTYSHEPKRVNRWRRFRRGDNKGWSGSMDAPLYSISVPLCSTLGLIPKILSQVMTYTMFLFHPGRFKNPIDACDNILNFSGISLRPSRNPLAITHPAVWNRSTIIMLLLRLRLHYMLRNEIRTLFLTTVQDRVQIVARYDTIIIFNVLVRCIRAVFYSPKTKEWWRNYTGTHELYS